MGAIILQAFPEAPLYYLNDEDREGARKEALNKLRTIYNAGTPFFTKDALRAAIREAEAIGPGLACQKICLRGLDGVVVEYSVHDYDNAVWPAPEDIEFKKLGVTIKYKTHDHKAVWPGHWGGQFEELGSGPKISFSCFQHLEDQAQGDCYDPRTVLTPIRIDQLLLRRNKYTGELYEEPSLPANKVKDSLDTVMAEWDSSLHIQHLTDIFTTPGAPRITKIVAFALGSIALDSRHPSPTESLHQHAMAIHLGRRLCCPVFLQDPVYMPLEVTLFSSLGATILPNPEGLLEMDDDTLVISIYPDVPIRQMVADIARPAAMIWNRVTGDKMKMRHNWTDPESGRLVKMMEGYRTWPLFEERDKEEAKGRGNKWRYHTFGDLKVYVRRD